MPVRVRGGLAGYPLELIDTQSDVAVAVQETQALWCYREERWSLEGAFNDHRGTAIHVANPFKVSS